MKASDRILGLVIQSDGLLPIRVFRVPIHLPPVNFRSDQVLCKSAEQE
jgi:hypothetical protein